MRILILTPRFPWPPVDGGRIAMANLAQSLQRNGAEVEVLSHNPRKHAVQHPAAPVPFSIVPIDTSRVAGPAARALRNGTPFVVERFWSDGFAEGLREVLRRFVPDVVQVESPFLLPYVPVIRAAGRARIALRSLNVEFAIWELLARNEPRTLRRFALGRVASSLRRYETSQLDAVDALVPISEADAGAFRALGCVKQIHVAPCGIDAPAQREDVAEEGVVGFIGSLDFRPNQEAVQWIVDVLWPLVAARAPQARLEIAGGSAPEWLRRHVTAKGGVMLGFVDDAAAFLRRASVVIAPLFAGGGMRIKVLEAMALGRPVVATPLGMGGIDVVAGRDVAIANDASSFSDAVVHLLGDREARARLGNSAREAVTARYDNDAIARDLLRFYESL